MKATNLPKPSLIVHVDAALLQYLGAELTLAAAEYRLPAPPIVPSFAGVSVETTATVAGTVRPGAKHRAFS